MPHSIEQESMPSSLDLLLSVLRKSPEGHSLITPREAREVLMDILYQYYVDDVKQTDAKIAVLRTVSQMRDEDRLCDFTEQVEKIETARRDQTKEDMKRGILKGVMGGVISPPKPKRSII